MSEDVRYGRSPLTGNWYKVLEWEEVEGHPERIVADRKIEIDESNVPKDIREAHEHVGPEDSGQESQGEGESGE